MFTPVNVRNDLVVRPEAHPIPADVARARHGDHEGARVVRSTNFHGAPSAGQEAAVAAEEEYDRREPIDANPEGL
jgi:hypothetical protein